MTFIGRLIDFYGLLTSFAPAVMKPSSYTPATSDPSTLFPIPRSRKSYRLACFALRTAVSLVPVTYAANSGYRDAFAMHKPHVHSIRPAVTRRPHNFCLALPMALPVLDHDVRCRVATCWRASPG